jgi:hypothetical protein
MHQYNPLYNTDPQSHLKISYSSSKDKYNDGWMGSSEIAKNNKDQVIKQSIEAKKGYGKLYKKIAKDTTIKLPLTKLVFHTISLWSRKKDGIRSCNLSRQQICDKSGIKKVDTISGAIEELVNKDYLISIKGTYNQPNTYFINIPDGGYECVTGLFLESDDQFLNCKQKAFICAVIPHTLGNDECRYSNTELAKRTGMGVRTIKSRRNELKDKGLITNLPEKGFKIDLFKIMAGDEEVVTEKEKDKELPFIMPKYEIEIPDDRFCITDEEFEYYERKAIIKACQEQNLLPPIFDN